MYHRFQKPIINSRKHDRNSDILHINYWWTPNFWSINSTQMINMFVTGVKHTHTQRQQKIETPFKSSNVYHWKTSGALPGQIRTYPVRIDVWYVYLHLPNKLATYYGKYTIHWMLGFFRKLGWLEVVNPFDEGSCRVWMCAVKNMTQQHTWPDSDI